MSLHSQPWKKLTAVAIFAALAGLMGGAVFQDKRIRKANAAIATYPGSEFVREFERHVKHLEYDDDFSKSEFELDAWFYFPRGEAKATLEKWRRKFEPTLDPTYGAEQGWSRDEKSHVGTARSPLSALGVDFEPPLFEIGYYMQVNEGGRCCAHVDKSDHWIRFHSYWAD